MLHKPEDKMSYTFLALKIKHKYLVDLASDEEKEMLESCADLLGLSIEDFINYGFYIDELASYIEDQKLIKIKD
jgi:hypothetical protein